MFFCSLQFLAFDTEASHDILKVWDGHPENEMALREVSGSLLPDGIHSTLNIVTIQFETDFYISKSGFAIDFSSKYFSLKPVSHYTNKLICETSLVRIDGMTKILFNNFKPKLIQNFDLFESSMLYPVSFIYKIFFYFMNINVAVYF